MAKNTDNCDRSRRTLPFCLERLIWFAPRDQKQALEQRFAEEYFGAEPKNRPDVINRLVAEHSGFTLPAVSASAPLDLDRAIAELDLVDGLTTADVLAELGLPDTRSNQVRVGAALKRAGFRRSRVRRGVVGRGYQYYLNPLNHRG